MNIENTYEHARKAQVKPVLQLRMTKSSDRVPTYRQQGIALVMVLWLLVLLTVIAASHARVIRTETRLASNQVEASKARGLAEAGANHAIMELMVRDATQRWPTDGNVNRIRYDNGSVAIAIRDARGLIDINRAEAALLNKVLAGMDMEETQRKALVDATLDWRDKDSLKRLNGAEDEDYLRAGLQWAARDGPFSSIEEFRYVLGMTNPLFEQLAPYLTVHSGQAGIKLDLAPPWLLRVMEGTQDISTAGNNSTGRDGSTFHITVWATTNGGSAASLDMVVRIAATSDQPYSILSWRAPARSISVNSG